MTAVIHPLSSMTQPAGSTIVLTRDKDGVGFDFPMRMAKPWPRHWHVRMSIALYAAGIVCLIVSAVLAVYRLPEGAYLTFFTVGLFCLFQGYLAVPNDGPGSVAAPRPTCQVRLSATELTYRNLGGAEETVPRELITDFVVHIHEDHQQGAEGTTWAHVWHSLDAQRTDGRRLIMTFSQGLWHESSVAELEWMGAVLREAITADRTA